MKTTVSIADDLYRRADQAAAGKGLNRSQFYAEALSAYLRELDDEAVTSDIDAALERMGEDEVAEWTHGAALRTLSRDR